MSVERAEIQIATVAGKYPGEAGSNTLTLSMDADTNKKLLDYAVDLVESEPKHITAVLWNRDGGLTGAVYSADNGEGDIISGLEVLIYDYPTATGVKTLVMHGTIEEVSQDAGLLTITASSALAKLKNKRIDTYWADTYRWEVEYDIPWSLWGNSWPAQISGVDAGWVAPPLELFACKRPKDVNGTQNRTGSVALTSTTDRIAQRISGADGNRPFYFLFDTLEGGTNTADLRVGIQKLTSAGVPDGTWIAYWDIPVASLVAAWTPIVYYAARTDDDPFLFADRLGETYALVFAATGTTTVVDISLGIDSAASLDFPVQTYDITTAVTWVEENYSLGQFQQMVLDWTELPVDAAFLDKTLLTTICVDRGTRDWFPNVDAVYSDAVASYFYGSVSISTIMTYLCDLAEVTDSIDAGITDTVGLYFTMGRTALECLQQLADLEDGGLGRQCVVYDYWAAGASVAAVRGRYTTADASARTFSDNSATDDELRIVRPMLKKSDALKVNTVYVVGESTKDRKVFAQAVDWTSRALFKEVSHTVVDKNLHDYDAALKEAVRLRDIINRSDWEGTFEVCGSHFDLMDSSSGASGTQRGGKIITLNIDELNITATKFKVRGVKLIPGKTLISVTNYDYSKDDEMSMKKQTARLADSFVASADIVNEYYCSKRYAGTVADYYMELQTAAGAAISGNTRVLCTVTTDGSIKILHAVFEPGNGYTVSGTRIGKIAFYAAATGGAAVDTVTLMTAEQFYKLKTSRVTVDIFADV